MASNTASTWVRRDRKHVNAGKRRKRKEARKSTPSYTELFKDLGEPGQPLPPASKSG